MGPRNDHGYGNDMVATTQSGAVLRTMACLPMGSTFADGDNLA